MWYEINVNKDGKNLFATYQWSFEKVKEMNDLFQVKFPAIEGYKVDITEWKQEGKEVKF